MKGKKTNNQKKNGTLRPWLVDVVIDNLRQLEIPLMKITVVKKSNGKVKTMAACPWILDEPPVAKSQPSAQSLQVFSGVSMKVTVIKKSNGKVKTMAACPWILDEPPVAKSQLGSEIIHFLVDQEPFMKITVIKKSNGKVKTMAACPWILDEPPVSKS